MNSQHTPFIRSVFLLCLLGGPGFGQPGMGAEPGEPGATALNLVDTWLTLEQQRVTLSDTWDRQQQQLRLRLRLLEDEKAQLRNALDQRTDAGSDVEQERQALLERQTALEQEQTLLGATVPRLLASLRSLAPRLPPPLANEWQHRLGSEGFDGDNSRALQTILELLSGLDDFQQRVSLHEGLIRLDGETDVFVRQLYLGAVQGWFVTSDGSLAGSGEAGIDGWRWRTDTGVAASEVLRALAMFEHSMEAGFVSLPLQLATGEAAP